jgi:hypothetical protein
MIRYLAKNVHFWCFCKKDLAAVKKEWYFTGLLSINAAGIFVGLLLSNAA